MTNPSDDDILRRHLLMEKKEKLQRLHALQRQKESIKEQLPHLYGWPWYKWAKIFFESRNKMNLLVAANQISKSSTQIRKCIDWATDIEKWPELWKQKPRLFWYIYPTSEVATVEFQKKWVTEFMPRGPAKTHPIYGWREVYEKGYIKCIDFNSGVTVYFKFHSQKVSNLQTATVDAVFADEEMPEEMYDEIAFRLAATGGYFNKVFTATLGQELWRKAMEPASRDDEKFPDALKLNVSMYDCLEYEDGSPTPWTKERIEKEIIPKCKSDAEVKRRVFGRFVRDEGKTYFGFEATKNLHAPMKWAPKFWQTYIGVDYGGGGTSHPSTIVFVAVEPGSKRGVVYRGWRGDDMETTAGDTIAKLQDMERGVQNIVDRRYDHSAKDLGTIARRAGITINTADKSRELGISLLNTLFRNKMLSIASGDLELEKLVGELNNLAVHTLKQQAKDDFIDALRYACMSIPWDWETLNSTAEEKEVEEVKKPLTPKQVEDLEKKRQADEITRRRGLFVDEGEEQVESWDDEFNEWNERY